jgi:hypothetical protein
MGLRGGAGPSLVRVSERIHYIRPSYQGKENGSFPLKAYGFTRKFLTHYEDDQITIQVTENSCPNIPLLIEHATMGTFYTLDEFASLYRALGLEFGIGHLNANETILILNHFDVNLLKRFQFLQKPDDSIETCKVLSDEWCEIRHEYVKANIEASAELASRKNATKTPCTPIWRFAFPGSLSNK